MTTDPSSVGVLAVSPLKRSPSFSRTATGASKSPVFTMKTSHAAKRQGDFFAEARASPTPHLYVEHLRSRRPGPLLAVALYKLAALKRLVNGYSVSPAKLIMDDDDESLRGHGRARVRPTQSCRASRAQQLSRTTRSD